MKKLILLFLTLLVGISASWAGTYTITFDKSTGSFYNGSNAVVTSGWVAKWVSNEAGKPAVTLTASANNINAENGRMAPGTSGSCTYSLSVEAGCTITGFELNCPTSGAQVTVTPNGEAAVIAATGEKIVVNSSATSFVYSGSNSGRILAASTGDGGSFKIFVEGPAEKFTAYNTAKGWINSIQSANGLVKDASKYISNAKSTAEGTYEALLDGDYATYFHTAYGNAGPDADHYLQAELTEAVDAIHFYYKKRSQNNNNRPTSITISGSNDGTTFTDITTISSGLPTNAAVINYASDKVSLGASYKYLRFTVTATNNGAASNGHVFFTFSEFYIMPANANIDAAITMLKNLPASAGELTDAQVTEINTINTALTSTTVNVTYELYESDGTTLVSSEIVVQNKNSAVAIPSSLTTNPYYDYATEGTIGTDDCTIKVTRTLKSSVVYPITNLSNNKAYTLTTKRGALGTDGTQMVSTYGTSHTKGNFAIISYEGNYYLYSVADSKFVGNPTTINTIVNQPQLTDDLSQVTPVSFTLTTVPYYFVGMGSNGVNCSTYATGIVVNNWTTHDDGNQYVIEEAAAFDPTAALAALKGYFYAKAIAQLETYTYGTGLGQYSLVVESTDYTSQAATIISGLKDAGYTEENMTNVQLLLAGTTINLPKANTFMRLKSNATGQYIGYAESGKQPLVDAANAGIYLYTADKNFVSYNQGRYLSAAIGNALTAVGTTGGVFNFYETAYSTPTYGTYRIRVADDANGSIIAWTDNYLNGWGAGDHERCEWVIEEVTSLPVTISAAGYATLYSPVALTIPSGVTAYVAADEGEYLTLTAIEGGVIPANTGVILAGEAKTYNFDITTGVPAVSNALTGTVAAIARPENSYILSKNSSDVVAFYKDGATTIPGFKAYLASGVGDVKEFRFDNETGIRSIDNEKMRNGENEMIFNLAGQRVAKAQKGLYIVNGKKLLVK